MRTSPRLRFGFTLPLVLLGVAATGCAPAPARTARGAEDSTALPPETRALHDAWVLRLHLEAGGSLQATTVQPPQNGCAPLVLPAGDAGVWVVAVDSACTAAGTWGPFASGHVAGGFDSPAFVLASSLAAERSRNAGARHLQLVRGDSEWSARTRLYRPAAGDFVVVESGPTRVLSWPGGRTRALLHYRLAGIGFSPALSRWGGIRSDEYALNRVVILDFEGQVLHESIVTKAAYDAARVFGAGRWMDWVGTSPRGDVVRVVVDLAGPAVRTAPVPLGWQHRTASPNGLYVLAQYGARLTLYRDTHPDLMPAVVWARDEFAAIQDQTVRDDGMVAYHGAERRARGEPALRLVCVAPDGREQWMASPLPESDTPRPGLQFTNRWLIEGLRAPLEPATDRIIVLHDLQT